VALIGIFKLISRTQLCHRIPHDNKFLLKLRLFSDTILKEQFVKLGAGWAPGNPSTLCSPPALPHALWASFETTSGFYSTLFFASAEQKEEGCAMALQSTGGEEMSDDMVGIPPVIESYNHRMAWVERTTIIIQFQPPCYVQGCQPADQAAQSHIQPGLECLQGWGIHNLLGQFVPMCHHPLTEKLPPKIQPKPPLSQFKTIPPCSITIHPHPYKLTRWF